MSEITKEEQKDLDRQVCKGCINYIKLLSDYFDENGVTTIIQVDSLIVMYLITKDDRIFSLLLKLHNVLLMSIVNLTYIKYRKYLILEDIDDMQGMIYEEFYRRVRFYRLPPDASFSGYVKYNLTKWMNVYTKLMVKKNKKYVLGDMDNYD